MTKNRPKNRLYLLAFVSAFAGLLLFLRLFQIQIALHSHYHELASRQHENKVEINLPRGNIYDRRGVPLALNIPRSLSFGVRPPDVKNPHRLASILAKVTGGKTSDWMKRLKSSNNFIWLVRQLDSKSAKTLNKIPYLVKEFETKRYYPFGTITPKALGFTDPDGNGIAGLEAIYNKQLTSIPGWETVLLDARVRKIGEPDIKPAITNTRPIPASELILTFDNVIQDIVSRELQSAVELWNAKGGMALVMLPRSGEILAMASQPACDPNNANDFSLDAQREINVVNMYEPGSTFKIVPLLSALNNGLNLEQKIFCENGVYPVGSHRIRDTHPHGYLTLGDVLVYSSNIGAAKVCRIVGKSAIYQTARDLGFGCQTGVEVPSEARGILSDFHKWDLYQSCTIGYGQGVSVTALQLACAYGAIANDGILMKPRILRGIKSPGSEIIYTKPVQVRRIASRNVANQMLELLIQVVERGTGKIAKIEGAVIAGKTGTAQIPISKKVGYSETDYISTFIGFTVNEPRLLCLVIIDRPQFQHLGGYVSAPVFKSIMERAIPIVASEQKYHSAPSNGGGWVEKEFDIAPYLLNLSLADAKKILNRQKVAFKIIGSGNKITGQFPSPGAILLPQKPLLLYTDSLAELALVGLPARQAVKKALSAGYYPQIEGEGLVQSATVDGYTCHLTCSNN